MLKHRLMMRQSFFLIKTGSFFSREQVNKCDIISVHSINNYLVKYSKSASHESWRTFGIKFKVTRNSTNVLIQQLVEGIINQDKISVIKRKLYDRGIIIVNF